MIRPLNVLVVGPGEHRGYGLATLRAAGHYVGVVDELSNFTPELADWWAPYPPRALTDQGAVVARSGVNWDVAVAWGELSLEASLAAARALGLPCAVLDVHSLRDKGLMRQRQSQAGLRVPAHAVVSDPVAAAERVAGRFPVIVKPVDYGGSSGVRQVTSDGELQTAVEIALRKSAAGRVIVEAVVEGPEYSVETVSFGENGHHSYAVVGKTVTPLPFRVETGHDVPADLPPAVTADLVREVHRTLDVLGMRVGASHAEVKLTADGPCVIEVGGRLAGDHIPQLVRLAYGVDLYQEEIRAVLGGAPPALPETPPPLRAAAMRVMQAPPGGYLRWPGGEVIVGTVLETALQDLFHWYPDNTQVPVADSSARRLGACLLAGNPEQVAAACAQVGLLGPDVWDEAP